MDKKEAAIVTAYTGFLIGSFRDAHEYMQKILKRPLYTHELAIKEIWDEIRDESKEDFLNIKVEDDTNEI